MTVHLVGAGPGDVDLMTLRAVRLLGDADAVVHDRLVTDEVLDLIAPWAQRHDVGKDPNGRTTSQDDINDLLVDLGQRHDLVVRLKGGDPFVFGRGGEEALALRSAGVDVDVVPAISSCVAAPAAAGIPVTHRGATSGFTVVTAHEAPDSPSHVDWNALARVGTTIVVLMGARRARSVSARLRGGGMAPDTPVAVVTSATTSAQRIERLRLVDLGRDRVANPSVIVIGAVAALDVTGLDVAGPAGSGSAATEPLDRLLEGALQ